MKEKILEVQNLDYRYSDGTIALKDITFSIYKGEKIVLLGDNGAGKSTLFLCLNGVNKPTCGEVIINHKRVDYSKKGLLHLRSKVGVIFQEPDNQIFLSDVYEEIAFGVMNLGMSKEESIRRVESIIDKLNIKPYVNKPTHYLSGGQKKQVSIADILVMNPEIILLDEPTASLDYKHSQLVRKCVDNMSETGITVMVSTHDVDYAWKFADRIILLKDGEVVEIGSPESIFMNDNILMKNNLNKPAVLKTYDLLIKKKWISPLEYIPKTMDELETMLNNKSPGM